MSPERNTIIGVLASHDDNRINNRLARVLDYFYEHRQDDFDKFRFVFTGGTYRRVVDGKDDQVERGNLQPVSPDTRKFLVKRTLILPPNAQGGVTILSFLIVEGVCSIVWPFFAPLSSHWLTPENLALMRLCDRCQVKRFMNSGSVEEWVDKDAAKDVWLNPRPFPPDIVLREGHFRKGRYEPETRDGGGYRLRVPPPQTERRDVPEEMTIALIAHDRMKKAMVKFARDHKQGLRRFHTILTTGTTGRLVRRATALKNIFRYNSGPEGGDIQIATEILFSQCDAVIFFIDPLNPHPHIDDIRVVIAACMRHDHVRLVTNPQQGKDWMASLSPMRQAKAAAAS